MAAPANVPNLSSAEAYRARMFERLGDRDPLQVLAETHGSLARIIQANPVEAMRIRPAPGKWSANEVIGHLLDSEWTYGFRIRLILCEDRPTILGMDQELWVSGQHHNDREPGELVEAFAALRSLTLNVWRGLGPADLERVGMHNERGPESLGLMRRLIAGHDLAHLDQIARSLNAV
jgi:hypothetical protein